MLDVHKIHFITSKFSVIDILNVSNKVISNDMIIEDKIKKFRSNTYLNQDNQNYLSELKRMLNYYLKEEYRSTVINEIAKKLDIKKFDTQYYVDIINLKKMCNNGMLIGSHSINHPVMSKLNKKKQKLEIESSFSFLKSALNINYKTYCHPYGGNISFNKNTLQILKDNQVEYSFSVENRDLIKKDLMVNLYSLPRYDCTEFPHGKAHS